MKIEHKIMIIFSIAGIILGDISYMIGQVTNIPELSILLLIIVWYVLKISLIKAWKLESKTNLFTKHGLTLYILLWLIVWTILYNL